MPNTLVTDAEVIRDYYLERYGCESTVIAYGVEPKPEPPGDTLASLGLEPGHYFLYVSRFEPENNPHRVAEAYRQVGGDLPLVMVGGAPYADRFIRSFTEDADPRILFPGPTYGRGYRELLSHALAYIHATEVGGTHPALVEAMGYGNCVAVNDTPENREVVGEAGIFFSADDPKTLSAVLQQILADPAESRSLAELAADRAKRLFSWDRVTDEYEAAFQKYSYIGSL